MKKVISILMFILLITGLVPMDIVHGSYGNNEYLDIKIGKDFNKSSYPTLSSKDGFYIYDKSDKDRNLFQIIDTTIMVSSNSSGDLDILDLQNNIIRSIPGDGTVIIGSGSMDNSIIQVDKNSYRDFISFIVKSETISLINHIDMENYLYGVVPREIGASFPMESIKAQAVAARTFAMANKNKHIQEGFNLCDTTHCQVYGGMTAEHSTTNKAVDQTESTYVYYKGQIAETTFHSNNGGYIESSKDVWGGHLEYLVAKEDVFSANTTSSTWDLKLTNKEVNSKVLSAGINIGDILDIEILERTQANRVSKLKLKGSLGEEIITGSRLRTILGNTSMKSTWFNITKEGQASKNNNVYAFNFDNLKVALINLEEATILNGSNSKSKAKNKVARAAGSKGTTNLEATNTSAPEGFIFEGRGNGHGVGMSQYGAAEMAKQGHSYEEILKHYYTGVDIIYNGK